MVGKTMGILPEGYIQVPVQVVFYGPVSANSFHKHLFGGWDTVNNFFAAGSITWSGVYYYHNKWVEDGSWTKAWVGMLKANKDLLDLSSMQLDGSHTPAKKQGENIGYQGRKAACTTNALFLADNTG